MTDEDEFVIEESPPLILQTGDDAWLVLRNGAKDLMNEAGCSAISVEGDTIYGLFEQEETGLFVWKDIVAGVTDGSVSSIHRVK